MGECLDALGAFLLPQSIMPVINPSFFPAQAPTPSPRLRLLKFLCLFLLICIAPSENQTENWGIRFPIKKTAFQMNVLCVYKEVTNVV